MKANRKATARHPFAADEGGIATALAAVLIVVILFLFLVVVQTSFIPQWEEDAEEQHARSVESEISAIHGALEHRLYNGTDAPASFPITLAESGALAFGGADLASTLALTPGTDSIDVSSDQVTVLLTDTVSTAPLNETWTSVGVGQTITGVWNVEHLRIRIHDPESGSQDDSLSLEVQDANGDIAGVMTVYIERYPSGWAIPVRVDNPSGDTLFDFGESRFQQDAPPLYWVNALQEDYLFDALLKLAPKPLTITLQEDGLQGDFSIQYDQQTAGGIINVGAGGVTLDDYETSFTGGSLSVELPYDEYPQQRYLIEHGALILAQPDGARMLIQPSFTVGDLVDPSVVTMAFTEATGSPSSLSQAGTGTVRMAGTTVTALTASAPEFFVNITSEHPSLWTSFWDGKLSAAGWTSDTHYVLDSGDDWARLELYGAIDSPASTDHDLFITLRHARVTTTLES